MSEFLRKVGVLLAAVPAWGAAVQSALTVVATEVVPLLPGDWQVQAAAWVAVALGWVVTIVKVVSRVTPVAPAARGLLPTAAPRAGGAPSSSVRLHVRGAVNGDAELVDRIRRSIRSRGGGGLI